MQTRRAVGVNQPALIPIAGNFDRKPRSLDREVTTVGRARGTDLCLEANEISTLHCIIYRTADGFRIRDCNSRCGTRINGDSIKTGALRDGDIVNLGPFSFEFKMPAAIFPNDGVRIDPVKVEHWKTSRRRLAQLALRLRKRTRTGGAPKEQEWAQKAHLLKEKIRCYDQRLGELEAAEEELADDRQKLKTEAERHRQHVQGIEKQMADRLAEADEQIRGRWQEFQRRCQTEEARTAAQTVGRETAQGTVGRETLHGHPIQMPTRETLHDGALKHAQEKQSELRDLEAQLTRLQDRLQREQQEFNIMKEKWVQDQTKSAVDLETQHAALAEKRADLLRMMAELKKMQEDLRKQAKPDVRALQEEVERLERENVTLRGNAEPGETQALLDENEQLRVRVQLLEASPVSGAALDDMRAELDLLHEELANKEKALNDLSRHGGDGDSKVLRSENDLLKKLLEEKNRVLDELEQKSKQTPKTEGDLECYETELNELRRQLEGDRAKLNKEVETLRERNKELDEAVREMEMEMSKERAELGRERMRLERVREEVKADTERLQRELAVRDSMAPLQKLRDELTGKQPPAKPEKQLNDRLRGIRNQLADSGSGPAGS